MHQIAQVEFENCNFFSASEGILPLQKLLRGNFPSDTPFFNGQRFIKKSGKGIKTGKVGET